MATEAWFRNPSGYVRELVEVGVGRVAWDRGFLVKKRIDPYKHASLYFGEAIPWELLLVGEQGTAHLDSAHDINFPKGVYPTFTFGEDASLLEEMVSRPIGWDAVTCADTSIPVDERPVFGQQHRVVVTELPAGNSGPGRKFLRYLKELQEDYPECIIHLHGVYSYNIAFGLGFRAADVESRTLAAKGKVTTPSGREMSYEMVARNPQWVTMLGFKPVDLAIPRNRCMYNIKSALWAGENFDKLYKFRTNKSQAQIDIETADSAYRPSESAQPVSPAALAKITEGDKFTCDTCSINMECKYSRAGAVCSVPGAEPTELARYFQTRDSNLIIDGLGTLLGAQSRRLQRGMQEESDFNELSPEVTKMLNSLFKNGVQLAKLVDPALQGGARVQVNVNGGATQVNMSTPAQLTGAIVRELEARGTRREDITPEMIQGMLSAMASGASPRQITDAKIIENTEGVA